MNGYLLLTGATGLLGRYLIRDLLTSGQRLALLVRDAKQESAEERIESILQHWEQEGDLTLPRPVLLRGDIRQPQLGLSKQDQHWVSRHCEALMHSAASLKFHEDGSGEPQRSNLDGTRNMLSLCRATGLRDLHYVSTAYVCGLREGTIYESDLDCGQRFRNVYEASKFEAESMVRNADYLDRLTVYRPAVISGDSQTGYTNTYHGIYLYLRLMAMLVPRQPLDENGCRYTPLRLPMTGDERRNVIPVDWVSAVMVALYQNPEAHGHTFHLAPERCLTPREIIDAGYSYFKSTGVEYVGYQTIDPSTYTTFEAELLPGLAMYHEYESTDPHFDCSNVKRFAGHLPCPVIDEAMLHKYIQFGEQDRWGKRRTPKAKLDPAASEYFKKFEVVDQSPRRCVAKVALNLTGPSGGQWTLSLQSDGAMYCDPGLDASADSLLKLSADEFNQMIAGPINCLRQHALERFFPLSLSAGNAPLRTESRNRARANPEPANG